MSLVIDLPPGMETQVYLAAAAEGVDVSTYIHQALAPRLRPYASEAMSEEELLTRVREDFPPAFWNRFRILGAKCSDGSLSLGQQREFTEMTDQTERRRVERLIYLIELAKRRGTTYEALMDEMGLPPPQE